MKTAVTHGYDRRARVPALPGTVAKLCAHCEMFFAARGKERTCDGCVSEPERLRRNQKAYYRDLSSRVSPGPSQSRTGGFLSGGPGTRKRRNSPHAPQVSGTVTDGGALCRELAEEQAEKTDFPKGRPQRMSRVTKLAYTRRNVALGLQGRCDLERYLA